MAELKFSLGDTVVKRSHRWNHSFKGQPHPKHREPGIVVDIERRRSAGNRRHTYYLVEWPTGHREWHQALCLVPAAIDAPPAA